jgi:hypothetical protein
MPRYFFHQRIGDRMMWDRTGVDAPGLVIEPDADVAAGALADILSRREQPSRILIVTDARGQMLFIDAR